MKTSKATKLDQITPIRRKIASKLTKNGNAEMKDQSEKNIDKKNINALRYQMAVLSESDS